MDKGIIFCRTKLDCDHCEEFLKQKGHSCVCLHGDRNPTERDENLKKFKVTFCSVESFTSCVLGG